MKVHTIRLLILFGLVLFAAYASHEAETKAQTIWKTKHQTTSTVLVPDSASQLF